MKFRKKNYDEITVKKIPNTMGNSLQKKISEQLKNKKER